MANRKGKWTPPGREKSAVRNRTYAKSAGAPGQAGSSGRLHGRTTTGAGKPSTPQPPRASKARSFHERITKFDKCKEDEGRKPPDAGERSSETNQKTLAVLPFSFSVLIKRPEIVMEAKTKQRPRSLQFSKGVNALHSVPIYYMNLFFVRPVTGFH